MKRKFALFICLAAVALGGAQVHACNVPVFRYALERWEPDSYPIVTPATPANLVAAIQSAWINLFVETNDTDRATVYCPNADTNSFLWSGPFTADNIRVLVNSPARRALVKEIQQGASAVWVLLESGKAKADDAAANLVETELAKLQTELRIPEVDPDDPRTADNEKLKTVFKTLRLRRTAPAERVFVEMLLGEDTNLRGVTGLPGAVAGLVVAALVAPLEFVTVVLVAAPVLTMLACWLPALWAAQQDPATILIAE